MPIGDRSRLVLFSMRSLMLSAAVCCGAVAGLAGCTDPLPGSTHRTGGATSVGGAMATGGRAGSGGAAASGGVSGAGGSSRTIGSGGVQATGGEIGHGGALSAGGIFGTGGASVGGSRAGGASGATGGASGGTSGTDPCAAFAYDFCVAKCLDEYGLSGNALCTNGAWSCRPGYVLASSCPIGACGVTPDACCDETTGIVTKNPCATNGFRAPCPSGDHETYQGQAWCIPKALTGVTCYSLDRQPCTEPAVGCSDTSAGIVTCGCGWSGSDSSTGTWYCSYFIGP